MQLIPSDPDIQTIISWIRDKDIELQPNFQRGEVWGEPKRRRLIDSILRQWHVPPIHVIQVRETAKLEVLDGQQRLAAIRDFAAGHLTIDGNTDPYDEEIQRLDGLTYDQLPERWRRHFNQFTVRVFRITDYAPEEPGELFFRLNQPTNLTAAEQRNAFFGPARQQVKDLVLLCERVGLARETVGFSNSRMAYDDVVSKLCLTLENGTLLRKVTAGSVTAKYRSREPFPHNAVSRVSFAIEMFGESRKAVSVPIKFNKATLYSWLCFVTGVQGVSVNLLEPRSLGDFAARFEALRVHRTHEAEGVDAYLLAIFNDRASSRVSDVSSVVLRDVILWLFYIRDQAQLGRGPYRSHPRLAMLHRIHRELEHSATDLQAQEWLEQLVDQTFWGTDL